MSQSRLDRRSLLTAASSASLASFIGSRTVWGQTRGPLPSLAPAANITARAQSLLYTFDVSQRTAASFPWNGQQWKQWNYFGASGYTKPGLRLEQMQPAQKDAAWALFGEVLSQEGITKAQNVMRLQETLMEEGDGVGQRSAEKFSVSVFGVPSDSSAWGMRLEGHHLTLSFAVDGGSIVSVTPQAFAVRPARVTRGRHAGLVTIGPEEDLARQLMRDLPPALQKRARVQERHLFNILSTAGRERANATRLGVIGADLTRVHQDLLQELVRTYAVKPYASALAVAQEARLKTTSIEQVSFAWYGDNTTGRAFGYRIISPAFVVEMGSIDSEAQHLHPVYHDLGNVLGTAA